MPKYINWINQIIRIIYVGILVFALFTAIDTFFSHIYLYDMIVFHIPFSAIYWMLIIAGAYALTIPYVNRQKQSACYLLFLFIGIFSGYFLLHDLFLSIILSIVIISLTYRAVVNEIRVEELTSLWMKIMLIYTFVLTIMIGFGLTTEQERTQFFYFLMITSVLYLVGISLLQLHHIDRQKSERELFQPWKKFNLWIWGSLVVFIALSIIILVVFKFGFVIFRWLIITGLTPVAKWVFTDLYDWIQKILAKLWGNFNNIEEQQTNVEQLDLEIEEFAPVNEISVFEIGLAMFFIFLLLTLIYMMIKFIKRKSFQKTSTTIEKSQSFMMDTIPQHEQPNVWNGFKAMLRNLFTTPDPDHLHEVRKEFRDLLKLLREKGYYDSDSMTVQQINNKLLGLTLPSDLYERLRYGDQNLTKEEILKFKDHIQRIKKELLK